MEALFQINIEGDGAISRGKPQTDTIKVTVDALLFNEQEKFGFGMVVRDSREELVQARSLLRYGGVIPEMAEPLLI